MIRYLKNNFNKNKKGISPLIATILLIVVAVAIIAIILNWGRDVTTTNLDDLSEVITPSEFSSGFVNFRLIRGNTFHIENLHSKKITITGYMIISDKGDESHDFLNTYIDLDPVIEVLPSQTAQINLACTPERNFQVNFRLSDNTYFTKNVTSTSPNINYCDTEYTPPEPLFLCDNSTAGGFFFSGEGTESEPYGICNCQMLQDINAHLDSHYELLTNIDCFEFENFYPIGVEEEPFTGSLYGNNFSISNLNITINDEIPVGFFSYAENASINNISFENLEVLSENQTDPTGGLIGFFENTSVENIANVSITGSVSGDQQVGGFVGHFLNDDDVELTFENINYQGDVIGNSKVAGFMGEVQSQTNGVFNFNNSHVNANILQKDPGPGPPANAGGFTGFSFINININNSSYVGEILFPDRQYIGGFIGFSPDMDFLNIVDSFVDANIEGSNTVAGFISQNGGFVNISNSNFTGNVSGENSVSGFISYFTGEDIIINESSFTGEVTATQGSASGFASDFYGMFDLNISNSNFEGNVTGAGNNVGGFSGIFTASNLNINDSDFIGNVSSSDGIMGGFSGAFYGMGNINISNSNFEGDVTSAGNNVGGFSGSFTGSIIRLENITFTGNVSSTFTGFSSSNLGGLVGNNSSGDLEVYNLNFTGDVTGAGNVVGGFAGWNGNNISILNSTFTGDVTSSGNQVSGIVSNSSGVINIDDFSFNGNVSGNDNVFGIGGNLYSSAIINDFSFTGNITGVEDDVSLLKAIYSGELQISNLTFKGDIQGNNNVSGLFLQLFTEPAQISNIIFEGDVSGNNNVAGFFLDVFSSGQTLFTDLNFTGNVTGSGNLVSGFGNRNYNSEFLLSNSIFTGDVTGKDDTAGMISLRYDGNISNNVFIGNIAGENSVGGLVAEDYSPSTSFINYNVVFADISGNDSVGGLIGRILDSVNLHDSYFQGNVSGNEFVGGIIGWADSDNLNIFENVYLKQGTVTGNSETGAFAGLIDSDNDSVFNNIFYNNIQGIDACGTCIPGILGVGKIEGKTEAELQQQSTFTGWDFTEVWGINPSKNDGMPYLQWED